MIQNTPPPKARLRRLNIRLTHQEWDKVHKLAANTTCRSVSDYVRKILSGKPVRVFYRNQSFDDFDEHMTRLIPQLETQGDNLSQLVTKLSALQNIPEVKSILPLVLDGMTAVSKTTEEIRTRIEKLSDQCDPK